MKPLLFVWLALAGAIAGAAQTPDSWLDRPLVNWNAPAAAVPRPPAAGVDSASLMQRCRLTLLRETHAQRALADAGWIPFLNVDQPLVHDDVEIVGGMLDADGMCRPMRYNLFVFVTGRFAGTLSPELMSSRLDASSGAVRIPDAETIRAEFARYTDKDALCCPTARVTVRFRIDRTLRVPVVVPVDIRTTRSL
jgi:hypothetical protein